MRVLAIFAALVGVQAFYAPSVQMARRVSIVSSMSTIDVESKLKEIVAEQLGVEQSSITADASFATDLGADSLDVVEMVMKIEEEFGVELPDERAEEVQNLSDAVRVVNDLLEK
mmetsp:Transcript_21209/g.27458  ORF Transcript_21209/g.27458 Transcript_21209/m.27458 type:complete len:114 (-) Transcript_21209:290-631(-)|eukprot:CAMPEP_0197331260 /NCGR_PEP_ID=MMETSP0892-20130614/10584_1 /TAXON_ID=44058 ORGANISM="Aureoumbra lagunensis, Strain CCMP1510" /NCGR_SAMPLE_ID=MMETSP0892 /ASSEMBLY_ACC=CAM_ASM_000538 /LENGTH=113 /DNA_ID=CAMNT_0042828991 /DNA_START=54 /DNA_END=395 /DNA_ORIENTATION=+